MDACKLPAYGPQECLVMCEILCAPLVALSASAESFSFLWRSFPSSEMLWILFAMAALTSWSASSTAIGFGFRSNSGFSLQLFSRSAATNTGLSTSQRIQDLYAHAHALVCNFVTACANRVLAGTKPGIYFVGFFAEDTKWLESKESS